MKLRIVLASIIASMLLGGASVPASAQMADHPDTAELLGAAEVGYAPFMFPAPDGTLQGFSFDMNTELAKRLGRPAFKVADVPWANIFAGLYAKRYEYIAAPTTITEKRADEMLFAEPYLDVQDAFVTPKDKPLKSMDELKGKKVAVVTGSVQDDWMTANAEKYGIEAMRFDSTPDAIQAVVVGRADSHMTALLASLWLIKDMPNFAVDLVMPVGGQLGLPFRPEDTEFRDKVELQLECMKADGTLADIYKKWFGIAPAAESSTVNAVEGFGAKGWKGYSAVPHESVCS